MSATLDILKVQPEMENTTVKLFQILDQQPSNFVKKDTLGTAQEQRLKAASQFRFPSISSTVIDGKIVKIRYIQGADTIIMEEQDKRGIKPNPQEDLVIFLHGDLPVANDFQNAALFTYLTVTSGNSLSPVKVPSVQPAFKEFVPSKEASNFLKEESAKHEAESLVLALYNDKGKVTTYEEERILMLCNVFGVRADSMSEKVKALFMKAKSNPEAFLAGIGNSQNMYLAEVREAITLGVINIDGKSASFPTTSSVFLGLEATKKAGKERELVEYFLTDKGSVAYTEMKAQMSSKKEEMLSEVVE